MLTYSTTNFLVVSLHVYLIWSIKLYRIGILINVVLWKQPHIILFSPHTCVKHIIYLGNNIWYLGLPILHKSYTFVGKKSVVNSTIHLHTKLYNSLTVLSFHTAWEDFAYNMVDFYHVYGEYYPADILPKQWSYAKI